MQIVHKNIHIDSICIDIQSNALCILLVGQWFQEQFRHPQLFWVYLVLNQMEKYCRISHLITCHQGLVSYFPLPLGLEQNAFFNFSCNSSSHPQSFLIFAECVIYNCLCKVLYHVKTFQHCRQTPVLINSGSA